jgi:hypothetical protein
LLYLLTLLLLRLSPSEPRLPYPFVIKIFLPCVKKLRLYVLFLHTIFLHTRFVFLGSYCDPSLLLETYPVSLWPAFVCIFCQHPSVCVRLYVLYRIPSSASMVHSVSEYRRSAL